MQKLVITQEDKLPKEFKKQWVKALKSGEFKKGKGVLKEGRGKNTEYCCLGVAAVLCNATHISGYGFLNPGAVRGITRIPKVLIGDKRVAKHLSILNDNNSTFKEVIEFIEKKL